MTISSAPYTTNSIKVTITNETSPVPIMAAVDTAITTLGWTQYDYIGAGSATQIDGVANTFNPMYTYVYRALCADAVNYKYFIVRWNPLKQQFFTSGAENWDLTLHKPLNETWNVNSCFGQGYDLKDCMILVSASTLHIILFPWIRGSMGLWAGLMEFERVAAEDTAAANVPSFAWTNSVLLGQNFGVYGGSTANQNSFIFPRTNTGTALTDTFKSYVPVTNKGPLPPITPFVTAAQVSTGTDSLKNGFGLASYYTFSYGWDATKTAVSPISADKTSNITPRGRAFNFSIAKPFGNALDTTLVPLGNGGWADNAGSTETCLILPLNGGVMNDVKDTVDACGNKVINISGRPQQNGYASSTAIYGAVLIGTVAWLHTGNGIETYDTTLTTSNQPTTVRFSQASASAASDNFLFDGFRTIYWINGSSIFRIDTETYVTSSVASGLTGLRQIALDGKYIYAAESSSSTQPKVIAVERWNTADGATGTGFSTVAYTYTPTANSTSAFAVKLYPNYKGFLYRVMSSQAAQNLPQFFTDKVNFTASPSSAWVTGGYASGSAASYTAGYYGLWTSYFDEINDSLYITDAYLYSPNSSLNSAASSVLLYTNIYRVNSSTGSRSNINSSSKLISTSNASNTYYGALFFSYYSTTTFENSYYGNTAIWKGAFVTPIGVLDNIMSQDGYSAVYSIPSVMVDNNLLYVAKNIASATYLTTCFEFDGIGSNYTNGTSYLKIIRNATLNDTVAYVKDIYTTSNSTGNAAGRLLVKG